MRMARVGVVMARAKHTRADERDIRELQQALNGAIFAKWTMQNGKDHIQ